MKKVFFCLLFLTACGTFKYPKVSGRPVPLTKNKKVLEAVTLDFKKIAKLKMLSKVKASSLLRKDSFRIALSLDNKELKVEILPTIGSIPIATYIEINGEGLLFDSKGRVESRNENIFSKYLEIDIPTKDIISLLLGKLSPAIVKRISFYNVNDEILGFDVNEEYLISINREDILKSILHKDSLEINYSKYKKYGSVKAPYIFEARVKEKNLKLEFITKILKVNYVK